MCEVKPGEKLLTQNSSICGKGNCVVKCERARQRERRIREKKTKREEKRIKETNNARERRERKNFLQQREEIDIKNCVQLREEKEIKKPCATKRRER